MKTVKNLLLFFMVILSIYLSSQVWLQLPDFLPFNKNSSTENLDNQQDIDKKFWELVRPHKYMIREDANLREIHVEDEALLWQNALTSLETALKNLSESQSSLFAGEFCPGDYIAMEFENKIPTEIFIGKFKVNKDIIKNNKMRNIKKIFFRLNDPNVIYLFNGDSTVMIKSSKIDNSEIYRNLKDIKESEYLLYKQDIEIDGEKVPIPIPDISTALNPVFVKSELDIKDKKTIEAIAKDYFKNTFDYVRRSEDIEGDIRYVYKNEKVLKISSDGLLDFFNSNVDIESNSNVYQGFLSAIKFASSFLNFHTDMYLSDVQSIQHERNFGYNFIFTYRIKNKPIFFSRIRESAALEVKVIGDSVVSYKRRIRDLDTKQDGEMEEVKIMSFEEVLRKQVIRNEDQEESNTLRVIDKSMIKDINNVYLAYYDYARNPKVQQLIVVWVVQIKDKIYVFNAITGSLLE